MNEVNLKLTVEETNILLTSLGNMPYSQVFQLISKIHQQASEQGGEPAADTSAKKTK